MVIFVEGMSGTGKTSGKPYHRYSFMEIQKDEKNDGKLVGRVHEFFADEAIDIKDIECGDVVKVKFETRGELDDRRILVGLEKIDGSVFRSR